MNNVCIIRVSGQKKFLHFSDTNKKKTKESYFLLLRDKVTPFFIPNFSHQNICMFLKELLAEYIMNTNVSFRFFVFLILSQCSKYKKFPNTYTLGTGKIRPEKLWQYYSIYYLVDILLRSSFRFINFFIIV